VKAFDDLISDGIIEPNDRGRVYQEGNGNFSADLVPEFTDLG